VQVVYHFLLKGLKRRSFRQRKAKDNSA
jgi:hypothetical protein